MRMIIISTCEWLSSTRINDGAVNYKGWRTMKYITMAILFMTPLDALARGCGGGCNTGFVPYLSILIGVIFIGLIISSQMSEKGRSKSDASETIWVLIVGAFFILMGLWMGRFIG